MKKLIILIGFSIVLQAEFIRDNTVQIVRDLTTSLYWQDNENISKTWTQAINYCENMVLGSYDDWRLPNINELNSIVDDTKYNPNMSPVFKSFASDSYWSSTTYADASNYAWVVYFYYGAQGNYPKDASNYVRCVRAGQ